MEEVHLLGWTNMSLILDNYRKAITNRSDTNRDPSAKPFTTALSTVPK